MCCCVFVHEIIVLFSKKKMWLQHAASSGFPQPGFYKSISTINSTPAARFFSDGAFYFAAILALSHPSLIQTTGGLWGGRPCWGLRRWLQALGCCLAWLARPTITVARGGTSCGTASPGSVCPPEIPCWAQMLQNMALKICQPFRARIILVIVFISSLLTTWGPSCMLLLRVFL